MLKVKTKEEKLLTITVRMRGILLPQGEFKKYFLSFHQTILLTTKPCWCSMIKYFVLGFNWNTGWNNNNQPIQPRSVPGHAVYIWQILNSLLFVQLEIFWLGDSGSYFTDERRHFKIHCCNKSIYHAYLYMYTVYSWIKYKALRITQWHARQYRGEVSHDFMVCK